MFFKIILPLVIGILISGCSSINPPNPYKTNIKKSNVPQNEKQKVLNKVLKEKYNHYYHINNGCISTKKINPYAKEEYTYNTCYKIEKDSIVSENFSKCYLNDEEIKCPYKDSRRSNKVKDYVSFINNVNIRDEYNIKIKEYKKASSNNKNKAEDYLKKYDIAKSNIVENLRKYNQVIIDNSNLIPSNMIKKLKFNKLEVASSKNDCYYNYINNKELNSCVKISGGIKNLGLINNSRFKFNINNSSFISSFDKLKNPITYLINNPIKFNFIPKDFVTKNSEILVTLSLRSNNIDINITNKTNNFIEIKTVSVYYDNDVKSLFINDKLPPLSKTLKKEISIPLNKKFVVIKSKNQNISFGIAVEYIINGKKKNLYDVREYSIKDFYK